MNEQQQKFEKLWAQYSHYRPENSPLFAAIHDAIFEGLGHETELNKHSYDLYERIEGKDTKFKKFGVQFFLETHGEWYIKNCDCTAWALASLLVGREMEQEWRWLTNGVTTALSRCRTTQAYRRFLEKGATEEHRKLLLKMRFEVDHMRGDWDSLFVQGKRPFGNSSREYDMLEILGWPNTWVDEEDEENDEDMPAEIEEKLWDIFDELPFALPALLDQEAP